jgi:hypothetical protein
VSPTPHIASEQIQTGKRDRTAVVVMPIGIGLKIDTRLVFTGEAPSSAATTARCSSSTCATCWNRWQPSWRQPRYRRDCGTKRLMVNRARLVIGERPSQTECDAPRPPHDEQL